MDEMYNAFCDMYHDDGSNDEKMKEKLVELLMKFLAANLPEGKSSKQPIPTKEQIDKLINTIQIVPSNLEFIARHRKINGTLYMELHRILKYFSPSVKEPEKPINIPTREELMSLIYHKLT
jgi:hypothetical protein